MVLEDADIEDIRDMFLRLQNGTPLKAQQKRNAMGSQVGAVVKELIDKPFFTTSVAFANSNAAHYLVAAQMLQLELKSHVVSCTSPQLDKFYRLYQRTSVDRQVMAQVNVVLKILEKIFPTKSQHLNQNYALNLYWLTSRIIQSYDIPEDQYPKVRQNFEDMDIARLEALERDYERPGDEVYKELSLAMSRGNQGIDGISTRHDIIGQFLFDGVKMGVACSRSAARFYA